MFSAPKVNDTMFARLQAVARLLACGAALAAGAMPSADANAQPITIGVIAELTNAGAPYSRDLVRGAEMAVREINAGGGIDGRTLKLMVVDGATNPARSAIVMRRLVASDVQLVVGGWGSSQVLANLEVAEQAGMPYIVVGATHPQITSPRNHWTFRVIQTDAVQAEQLARLVTDSLGARRIAVISDSNAYGAGSRDVFLASLQRAGLKPVRLETFQGIDRDFAAQLARIKEAQPDVLAIFGTVPAAPLVMEQARKLGISARFVGTGGLANEVLIDAARMAAEGTLLMSFFHEDVDDEARAWADRYRREFAGGAEPPRPLLAAWEYRAIRGIA
jgi:branched-chain amino acid transport system substrate-binding protein